MKYKEAYALSFIVPQLITALQKLEAGLFSLNKMLHSPCCIHYRQHIGRCLCPAVLAWRAALIHLHQCREFFHKQRKYLFQKWMHKG